ncbi:MAG: hypothetical protein KDA47_19210 [Planctomycetales bacterium]|nr:hypothetical protein [Planctomycetales bacterium]
MKPPTEAQAVPLVIDLLSDFLAIPPASVDVRSRGSSGDIGSAISVEGYQFISDYKPQVSAAAVSQAIESLQRSDNPDGAIRLVVVPFMGDAGRGLCDRAEVSWLDLSGNARVFAPGLRIQVEGRPNKFVQRGRPPNVFAPKSSRVARQLLLHPRRFQTQAELARETGLGDGYVSKIANRLKQQQYLETDDTRAVRPANPDLMLDAWAEAYDFQHHRILAGHVPARSGFELLELVGRSLTVANDRPLWAATGLAAAWLYTEFATFRLATFYLAAMPARSLLDQIGFVEETRGANLWFVLPDDDGVFQASRLEGEIRCVSPLQAYLDLKGHPERANDAAAELRRQRLTWS